MNMSRVATAFTLLLSAPSTVLGFAPVIHRSHSSSTRRYALIDVSENAPRNLGPFNEWATMYGVQQIEGFQLTTTEGLDYSVQTTSDLPGSQTILSVPGNMILRSSTSKDELMAMSPSGGVEAAVKQLGMIGSQGSVPEFYLFLKILVEYERGDQSSFFPWLDSLPRLYYNAVSMTDFCYECLPPLVYRLSRAERIKFDNFLQVLQKVDVVSDNVKRNTDVCKWAFNTVYTRCKGDPGTDRMIVPMADMFNHGTETEIDIAFDEQGNCNAYTTRDVPAGSPLRMSYGCTTNPSMLFATYGFLDETAPATFCKIMDIKTTPELVNIGLDYSRMLFYKDTGEISEEVWDTVLYGKVLAANAAVKKQFYEAHMTGDANTKQTIHQQFMLETATEIQSHVDTFLKALVDLSAKGDGKDLREHPRLPLILKHNDFVRSTFMNVKSRIDPMVAQAAEARAMS